MKNTFHFLSLVTGILLLSSVALLGQAPVLTNAVVDLDAETLTIFGDEFGAGLQVFIGTALGTLEEVGINSSTSTSIEVALSTTAPGTYLVAVSTNIGMSAMDVTIGAHITTQDIAIGGIGSSTIFVHDMRAAMQYRPASLNSGKRTVHGKNGIHHRFSF